MGKPHGRAKENLLYPREREELLKSVKYPHERLLIVGLLYTGMRISEFIHMNENWVDFEYKWIRIPREQECSCRECIENREGAWRPKTEEAVREIKMLSKAEEVLKPFFDEHSSIMDVIKSRQRAYSIVKSVANRTNITHKIFPHALRGTFASILAGREVSIPTITGMLGWKSMKTADDYIKISPDAQEREIKEKLENA